MQTVLSINLQFRCFLFSFRVLHCHELIDFGWTEPLFKSCILFITFQRDLLLIWFNDQMTRLIMIMISPTSIINPTYLLCRFSRISNVIYPSGFSYWIGLCLSLDSVHSWSSFLFLNSYFSLPFVIRSI